MFEHAVIGVDLSSAADPILDCVEDMVQLGIRRLTLVHVLESNSLRGLPDAYGEMFEDFLRRRAAPLRQRGLVVEARIRFGSSGEQLLAVADDIGADLVIIGSRGHSLAFDLVIGSTAKEVIASSHVPVLLESVGHSADETRRTRADAPGRTRSILLLTDLTEECSEAMRIACRFFGQAEHAVALHVLPDGADERRAAEAIGQMAFLLPESLAGKVTVRVECGEVDAEAARVAEEERASLVILGQHHANWLVARLSLRLSEAVCKATHLPILIVPPNPNTPVVGTAIRR